MRGRLHAVSHTLRIWCTAILWAAALLAAGSISAQAGGTSHSGASQPCYVSIGFYNTENLFDTIPSPFYDDSEYTPEGQKRWDTGRYTRKLANIARIIDDAGFDVVVLAEVENESVVRDLVLKLRDDYCYIHRSSSDRRGIDIAMLYKGDRFFPGEVRLLPTTASRELLLVRGRLMGEEVGIIAAHLPSKYNGLGYRMRAVRCLAGAADSLICEAGCSGVVVLGDFNGELGEPAMRRALGSVVAEGRLCNVLPSVAQSGLGSYCWQGQWFMYDNVLVSEALARGLGGLRAIRGGVFLRDYMLDSARGYGASSIRRTGYPMRTFHGSKYVGGYSDHLPVFVVLAK